MPARKVLYLGNQLSYHGYTPTSVETLGKRLSNAIPLVRGSNRKNPILRLLHMWWLTLVHRDARYLLLDTYSSKAFWYALSSAFIANLLQLPYIPILHGGNLPNRLKSNPRPMRWFLSKATKVVCPSGYLLHEMETFYQRNYELISNYIDLEQYPYRQPAYDDGIHLLWVRSFHQIYNPQMAIILVHKLKERGLKVQLSMVGPDKDGTLQECKNLSENLGLMDHVHFTGRLSKAEWIALAANCNAFINTTHVDNTPVSVMEAMALGLPVVSTNVGGIPYLLKHGADALLVEDGNVEQMEEAVIRLMTETDLAESLSRNARRKAESWDWKVVEKQWLTLLASEGSLA
jgi:glycosyltransferase involved in cell wall biosynthesis